MFIQGYITLELKVNLLGLDAHYNLPKKVVEDPESWMPFQPLQPKLRNP